jgi:hypothetical protein
MEQLGSHWKDFNDIEYFGVSVFKSVDKIQFSLKPDQNNRYFT